MAYRNLTDIHEKDMSFWMSLTTNCPGLHGYMKVLMAKMVTYKYKFYSLVSQYEVHIYHGLFEMQFFTGLYRTLEYDIHTYPLNIYYPSFP